MEPVIIEVDGVADDEQVEPLLESADSGFEIKSRGIGRTRRYSSIGDIVTIIGGIASTASLAKTVLEIVKLQKKSGKAEIVVRIKGADGHTVSIKSSDGHSVADVASALKDLK